jgi:hypothetical protein
MRLSGIDRWQGLTRSTGNGKSVSYSYSEWNTVDSMMVDSIMFYKRGWDFYGFDSVKNRLYVLRNGVKKVYLDFSVPSGFSFISSLGGSNLVTVHGSGNIRSFTAHYGYWPTYDIEITTEKDIGETIDNTLMTMSSHWSESFTKTLNQISRKTNDEILYIGHGYVPTLSFEPPVSPSPTYSPLFQVSVGHMLNSFLNQYLPSFSYIDSLFIDYYYTNGSDSTGMYNVKRKAGFPNSFLVQFDSSIIKNGYYVKYRVKLRDRSILPKYAYSPSDQSFDTLHFDLTVGIEDEVIPESYFQIATYPNPFNNTTTLQIAHPESGEVTVTVYSMTGEKVMPPVVMTKDVESVTIPLEFKSLPSGMYIADINFISSSAKYYRNQQKLIYLK